MRSPPTLARIGGGVSGPLWAADGPRPLGRAVAVRCVVANVELAAPDAAGDANLMAEARRIFADDLVDVGEIT